MNFSELDLDCFPSVREHDIDIALVLGLRASERVRRLFADIGGCSPTLVSVRGSRRCEDGREVDIELILGDARGRVRFEVENKLVSPFQREQCADYGRRATRARERDGAGTAFCVLVAPNGYLRSSSLSATRFDGTLSYERLRDTIGGEPGWGRELALLFEHAIRRHRRGSSDSPDSDVRTRFFDAFVRLAAEAGLPTLDSKQRKPNAGFLWYPRKGTLSQIRGWRLANASHGVWLVAKFVHGSADVEITGGAHVLTPSRMAYALRDGDIQVEHDARSVRLRASAPVLDPDVALDAQTSQARSFVERLAHIRRWWESTGRYIAEASLARVPEA